MKIWPKKLKHRGQILARIYKRNRGGYRLKWRVTGTDGNRHARSRDFISYGKAKQAGDQLVKDLTKGSLVTALTPKQAQDAMHGLQTLNALYLSSGLQVSLSVAAARYAQVAPRLKDIPLGDIVDAYFKNIASVKRVNLAQAVEQFIEYRRLKTVAKAGKRPPLSPEHAYNTALCLRRFAGSFQGWAVCDLTKAVFDKYMTGQSKNSTKTRNEIRGILKMLIKWSVAQDYLEPNHRLFEAVGFGHEGVSRGAIETYRPTELRAMLERASLRPAPHKQGQEPQLDYRPLLPVLALAGLAGMRFKEITRMTFKEVFQRPGFIEVKMEQAKTRSRRLIDVCPALAAWLEPYHNRIGPVWPKGYDMLHTDFAALRKELGIANRRNGLRHTFITAHYAAHSNEGLTSRQAGNSPEVLHAHYNGLWTQSEGLEWLAVSPVRPDNVVPFTGAKAAS